MFSTLKVKTMKELSIKLKNCYGIGEIDQTLNFNKSNACIVYAPNGVMKTSLAKTFLRIASKQEPEEKLYGRKPEYEILVDGKAISSEQILVVRPFDPDYESKNVSTLLVNAEKKAKYESIYSEILDSKKKLITKLNKASKVKADDIESQISKDFGVSNIFDAIKSIQSAQGNEIDISEVKYNEVFDEKVIELLSKEGVKLGISEYASKYNELLEGSPIYSKGKFNPANADAISKSLKKEKFFEANHRIVLNGNDNPVTKLEDFESTLKQAHEAVLSNKELQSIHSQLLSGVASVKTFQSILERVPAISGLLNDLESLRSKFWVAYYVSAQSEFDDLITLYETKKAELSAIEVEAQLEETAWHKSKETFKARFHVPFDIEVENQINAILGTKAPNIAFTFKDDSGKELKFNRGQLSSLDTLSVGERRAMYLLYVIFEFLARINSGEDTLVIVDDIADSFDYKNKFAIIEYLKELSQETSLRLLILTHNFDFYRTVQGRILVDGAKWENSFIAKKVGEKVLLVPGGGNNTSNPFELWRKGYSKSPAMLISLIPFVRNLIEYRDGTTSEVYSVLTSMLHLKGDTLELKVKDLLSIVADVIKETAHKPDVDENKTILSLVYETADQLCAIAKEDEISLENKVTLSIACRLLAENYMLGRVVDKTKISGNQTAVLFDRLKKEDTDNKLMKQIKVLAQVTLMTPENIHLNSFMYEPLMDMSVLHLVDLYNRLKNMD